jgi:FMN phosphatase YigB (HAD superfamily)
MIRNIILDLGNVLLSWKPYEYFEKNNYPEAKIEVLLNDIFKSDEWLKLDNGDISIREAIEMIALKSSLNKNEIALVFDQRIEILHAIENNIKLLPLLKKRGFNLYYLSNFPMDIFPQVLRIHDFFRHFDGGFISAEVRLSKPDTRIYKAFLDKYQLKSEETLFIDDLDINVQGARESGITSIYLDNPEKLSEYIENIIGP